MRYFVAILILTGCGGDATAPVREIHNSPDMVIHLPTAGDGHAMGALDAGRGGGITRDSGIQALQDAGTPDAALQPLDAQMAPVDATVGVDAAVSDAGLLPDAGHDAGPPPQTCDLCERTSDCPPEHGCLFYDDELRCLPRDPPVGPCQDTYPDLAGRNFGGAAYCAPNEAILAGGGCPAWQAKHL